MEIKRVINHNVIIAQNTKGRECVLIGKGVGFGKKIGEKVDEKLVVKTFITKEKGTAEKLSRIVQSIPTEHIKVCDEIINAAKAEWGNSLNESIYLTLIDHLSFAIQRHNEGINLTSTLKWEMKQLYPKEYAAGLNALEIIEKRIGIVFPEDEAAYIAFHFVNARAAGINVTENLGFVQDIFEIVRNHFNIEIDEESVSYNRFLTHLKYFSYRVINNTNHPKSNVDSYMLTRFRADLPDETECASKISGYISENYQYTVSDSEKEYLIIHLHSMLTR